MIDAGILDHPRVEFSVGCHLWADIPEKTIGVRAGTFMAAIDRFNTGLSERAAMRPCRIFASMLWKSGRR